MLPKFIVKEKKNNTDDIYNNQVFNYLQFATVSNVSFQKQKQ